MGAQVSRAKVNSDVESEWFWLMGNCNASDMGTRTTATWQDP
jgi:hypothetical protein